jgi:2,4-dienoyl-CoA reductase-like NADH-dependent reductase (Old Yellow Enzyme family)/thioredoxin reductase
MAEYDALLEPFRLKHLIIRNRIMSTSHATGYPAEGMPAERYQAYQEAKAAGGIGLTMFGGSSAVSPDCRAAFGQINAATDAVIPHFQKLAERVQRHGAAVMCQISHMGRRSRWDAANWLAPVAPSALREPEHRSFPKEMEPWDFARIRRDFAAAAKRCKEGGLDGAELSYSGTHLIPQFLSPLTNKRNDDYGGSLENRMRFGMEVLEAAREAVGADYVLGLRISGDELLEGGLSAAETLEVIRRFAATGMVDFVNVMHGSTVDYRSLAILQPNMSFSPAPFLYLASAVKQAVDIPVFHAGRITDLATAARAVAEGHVDLVAMTRAHLADPQIAHKLAEGRPEDIRQCVGANYCVDHLFVGEALCVQNPATGRETALPHAVPKGAGGKTVVIAGGGPAGLEAARVAARRGHRVVLFEVGERTGGQVNLAAKAGWREALSGVTRWLDAQARKEGADIRTGVRATEEVVLAEKPDAVIVATGGSPNKGPFEGAEHAVSSWDILAGTVEAGESVLLFDDQGDHQGMSVAELLAGRGSRVELVYPERFAGVEVGLTNWPIHLRELYGKGVVMTPDLRLTAVYPEGNRLVAVLRNEYTLVEEERVVDQVVAEHGTLPNDDLYFALVPQSRNLGEVDLDALIALEPQTVETNPNGRFQLFRVGDAVASRNLHAAIYDSLRLCLAL